MNADFPGAVPEVRVHAIPRAALYYEKCLGFSWDWGMQGIAQVSRGACRIFLTDDEFRGGESTWTPSIVWLNLDGKAAVDALHDAWRDGGALIVSAPESKPWNLHEFTAADPDGNTLRVFYDFAWELPDRGGREDDTVARDATRDKA